MGDDGFLELRMVFRARGNCSELRRFFGGRGGGSEKGLATRQAGDVLLGGASGAGRLLLNTKASQEAVCSRAPAAIVPGQEPSHTVQV